MIKILSIAVLLSVNIFAQTQTAVATENSDDTFIDRWHYFFSNHVDTISNSFDSLFGNQIFDDTQRSTVTLEQFFSSIEDRSMIKETRFRARWIFPNMKKKLKLVINQAPRANQSGQEAQDRDLRNKAIQRSDNLQAGLDYSLGEENNQSQFTIGSGIQIRSVIDPYIRTRYEYKKYLYWTNLFINQSVFLYKEDGFGANLKFDFKNQLSVDMAHTFGNFLYWYDGTDLLEYVAGPSFAHQLSEKRVITYNFKLLFDNRPNEQLENHLIFINYRQLLHRKWLYAELIPSLEFPRSNNWRRIAAITFKIQVIFGAGH